MRYRLALPLLMALAAPARAEPCSELVSGAIVDFTGTPQNYEILRGSIRIPAGFFVELQGGDRLRLLQAGRLSVERADGGMQNAIATNTWFCVRASEQASWWKNARRMVGDLLTNARNGMASLITRTGGDLVIAPAAVAVGSAVVAPGSRRLALAWQGGTAPFTAEIQRDDGPVILREADINARLLRKRDPADLAPGRYVVRVRDAEGFVANGSFRVLAGLPDSSASSPEAALAKAGQLYASSPSRSYDAFLTLSPYRADNPAVADFMAVVTVAP